MVAILVAFLEQLERLIPRENIQRAGLRADRRQDARVARREEQPPREPELTERRRVPRVPHVVEDHQAAPVAVAQELGQTRPAPMLALEDGARLAERCAEFGLEQRELRVAAERDPEDAVRKCPLNVRVPREPRGEHALSNPAHAVHARASRAPREADSFR